MKPILLFLSILGFSAPIFGQDDAPPKAAVEEYIRYVSDGDGDRLQTAVQRFQRGDQHVDLVAVVHLADKRYFEALNRYLQSYDVVLYELVGGRFPSESVTSGADDSPEEMGSIRSLQQMAKSILGLEFQLDEIDYGAPNFVHADVDWDQYQELMVAKNQTFATLMTRAMSLAQSGDAESFGMDEEALGKMMTQMFTAITTGDSTELKRGLAPLLAEAEGFINQLEGEDGTVIVTERNKLVMQKLNETMSNRSRGKYAIFYGAGHMPDLERRLLANGFHKGNVVWADAWTLGQSSPSSGGTAVPESFSGATTDMLLKLIEDNPEIVGAIQELGETLEKLSVESE